MASDTAASTRTYAIDKSHSSVNFAIRHLMISKVRGTFSTVAGTIVLPPVGFVPTAVSAEIDAASVTTHEEQRDTHLKSADFFDVETFPKMTFTSTEIAASGENAFTIDGTLEMHGVSRPVTLTAELAGHGKDPWGNDRIAYEATTKLNRKDHGMTFNQTLEAGGVLVGEEVEIIINLEAVAAK